MLLPSLNQSQQLHFNTFSLTTKQSFVFSREVPSKDEEIDENLSTMSID